MLTNLVEALRLVAVTDDRILAGQDVVACCCAAVRGGATAIQLRLKQPPPRELAALARSLLATLQVPLIINDRADVAIAVGAAGVHLGPDDLAADLVRRAAPPGFVIGASVGSLHEAASGMLADYWGIGPLRQTGTKRDAGGALGLEGFATILALAGRRPCVAIGGVRPEDVARVRGSGGAGVAVVSGIFGAGDVESAARRYVDP